MTGHCNQCGKIWTLNTKQGVCQWCGQLTVCQTSRTQALRSLKSRSNGRKRQVDGNGDSYNRLDGDWLTYYKVAQAYEGKVPAQDRDDIRHDIMIELDRATKRDGKPIPLLRAYRIASLTVALYWRERVKHQVKVCIYSGLPTEPHCAGCSHNGHKPCPYLALRPIQSLDSELGDDSDTLADTIADDHALDLDAWLDAKTWLLGCPMRLVQIASKISKGQRLTATDRQYLWRYHKRQQKTLPMM